MEKRITYADVHEGDTVEIEGWRQLRVTAIARRPGTVRLIGVTGSGRQYSHTAPSDTHCDLLERP